MKKIFSVALAVLSIAFLLIACGDIETTKKREETEKLEVNLNEYFMSMGTTEDDINQILNSLANSNCDGAKHIYEMVNHLSPEYQMQAGVEEEIAFIVEFEDDVPIFIIITPGYGGDAFVSGTYFMYDGLDFSSEKALEESLPFDDCDVKKIK